MDFGITRQISTRNYTVFIDDHKRNFTVARKLDVNENPDIVPLSAIVQCRVCLLYTSGGTVMRQCNVDEMKKNGTIVLLTAEPETVYERVKGSHNRPLLEKNMNPEYIKELMEARRPKYEAAADFVIKTDNRTAEEICLEINKRLKTVDN